tara:strand:- start:23398 stop:23841 length:444 start_codon:yes stop_codon:yes gene_type:complete
MEQNQEELPIDEKTSTMYGSENEVAFKDFQKSISVGEFKAVIAMAKQEYMSMKKVLDARNEFLEDSKERIEGIDSQGSEIPQELLHNAMPQELRDKIYAGFLRRTKKDIVKRFTPELERLDDITEFINRFQPTSEEYPKLNFNFINQ